MPTPFWRSDSCTVTLSVDPDGALRFHGHDVRAFGTAGHEYEYVVTVDPTEFSSLRAALGVAPDADLRTGLVERVDDVMSAGESSWLTRHGVEHRVEVWDRPPD